MGKFTGNKIKDPQATTKQGLNANRKKCKTKRSVLNCVGCVGWKSCVGRGSWEVGNFAWVVGKFMWVVGPFYR